MDRLDAMTAFVTTVDARGMSAAARRLGRSPASITRAIAFLEARLHTQLLRRTTRTVKLTDAGERYLPTCRRILAELAEAEALAGDARAAPHGTLTLTAPATFGRLHVRAIVDTFLAAHAGVQAHLLLLDRVVSLVDEGIDLAVRIAHLADSSLLAVKVGEVRRLVCASPAYLGRRGRPTRPADLPGHDCISFAQVMPTHAWTFAARPGGRRLHIKLAPRLTVNSAEAAIASAIAGGGVTSVLSYQVDADLQASRLVRLLKSYEPDPLPVHVVVPAGSASTPKVRAFLDLAVPRLRAALGSMRS